MHFRLASTVAFVAFIGAAYPSVAQIPSDTATNLVPLTALTLPPDTAAPAADSAAVAWVKVHAKPLRSLTSTDFTDLEFLRSVLAGRRIVQLGESGHGVKQFNLAKVRLVKYLHEQLGYDVLAFEAGFHECWQANEDLPQMTADSVMRACMFGVWQTQEHRSLFEYLQATRKTKRPLILAGFDIQMSSVTGNLKRAAFLRDVAAQYDSAYAQRIYVTDSAARASIEALRGVKPLPERMFAYSAQYDTMVAFYDAKLKHVKKGSRDYILLLVARETANSMPFFIRQRNSKEYSELMIARDTGMADKVSFLANQLYAGKKLLIWAHNTHIQHATDEVQENQRYKMPLRTMGWWLHRRFGRELYTVGLFMYRGTAADNEHGSYNVRPATPGSLEAIMHRTDTRYVFLDLSTAKRSQGTSWLFTPIVAKTWGLTPETQVIRDQYDGLLFIDTTEPPDYLKRAPADTTRR